MAANDMVPLSEVLTLVEHQYGVKLYAGNLTTSRADRPSIMEQLSAENLARAVQEGKRRRWMVSPDAVARLVTLAAGGRPGPGPGAQVTLAADQIGPFARTLASANDPASAIQDALAAATGLNTEALAKVEKVVIPVSPRRPPGPHKEENPPQGSP